MGQSDEAPVTRADLQLVSQEGARRVEKERIERQGWQRRAEDRAASNELELLKHRKILTGEDGTNGLVADVRGLKWASRLIVAALAVASNVATGVAVWYLTTQD